MSWKRWMNIKIRKEFKQILQISIFILIASLPFISLTNIMGIETFLDSFDNPESYIFIKNSNEVKGLTTQEDQYVIIQKTTHPDFEVQKDDEILYFNINGEIECNKIFEVTGTGFFTKYYIQNQSNQDDAVYQAQIVGKVIKNIDNNIWNELSLKLWDLSIRHLNIQKAT
jgi:hypothetical protein